MRYVSFIVLLLWVVCYGRCLADQHGLLADEQRTLGCGHACCENAADDQQSEDPAGDDSCKLCEFIQTGGAPTTVPFELQAPVEWVLVLPVVVEWVFSALCHEAAEECGTAINNTGPPGDFQLCEWMASTAMPVRGPTTGA